MNDNLVYLTEYFAFLLDVIDIQILRPTLKNVGLFFSSVWAWRRMIMATAQFLLLHALFFVTLSSVLFSGVCFFPWGE